MTLGAVLDPQGPPLPSRQIMNQWWRDVVFVHWRVDPDAVAGLLPRGVRPDVHDGSAWVGLVPFRMVDAGLGHRGPVPRLGTFLETNVRTYSVDAAGRRGVVFLSLDCDRAAVVAGAVATLRVPYRWARIAHHRQDDVVGYRTARRTGARPRSEVAVRVGAALAEPSPRDVFLTARFGLHTRVAGRTLWVPNTHGPWPLHAADVVELDDGRDGLLAGAGLDVGGSAPDSVLFSPGVHTVFGLPRRA
ncbi:DUF2071 domain-containing protein [Nocardioides sp. 1609]|uniref:YqjF family protein n=1 Tax=Nocardioides sp. 1609 TaxID=2508327 RepID=UPI00106F88AB|nr:DUF2071 domain-containing protein [Nocardioides sp. 1609]